MWSVSYTAMFTTVKLRFDEQIVSFSDWHERPMPRDVTESRGAA